MKEWSENFVHADGIEIHYHRTGDGKKPPLILLHGITDNGLCWSRVARDLEQQYSVYMPDARGHGCSSGVETGFSYELLARDVLAFIHALQLEKPFLYGHSMGAMTALVAASTSDSLRAIVLEDPPFRLAPPVQASAENARWNWQWVFDLKTQSDEERKPGCRIAEPDWVEEEIAPWSIAKGEFDVAVLQHRDAFSIPWRTLIPHVSCPILLITGDSQRGAIVTPQTAQEMAKLWKQGAIAHIEGASHSIHRDRYAATLTAVRAFLEQNAH